MSDSNEQPQYATYRGTSQVAMLLGIPLIPCLVLFGLLIFEMFIFFLLLKWQLTAFVLGTIICCIGVWLRFECMFEPRAIEIRTLEFKGLILRFKKRSKVLEVTSMIESEDKEIEDVQRFIKEKTGF